MPLEPIALDTIRKARVRIRDVALHTPLIRFEAGIPEVEVFLKLENLQPIGSFKIRGAANAMGRLDPRTLAKGVITPSAGNMGQGVAWNARRLGVACQVIVPESAPRTKLDAIERLGARVLPVAFDSWWNALVSHRWDRGSGHFIHPVSDPDVIAGNGSVGLEILDDLPDVDAIIVPFGGGGLSCGIACAARSIRPEIRVYASEVETAAPLSRAFEVGKPVSVRHTPSFVDGIGGKTVLAEMWPLARDLLEGSLVCALDEVARAIRLLVVRSRIVAEGAGATSVAAALAGRAGHGKVVCVISGGNINPGTLARILDGAVP